MPTNLPAGHGLITVKTGSHRADEAGTEKAFCRFRRPMWAGAFDLIIKSRQVASSVSSPARWGRRFEISRPASFQNKVKTINLETQRKQRFFGIVTLTRDVRLT